jgi:hypothetical protein
VPYFALKSVVTHDKTIDVLRGIKQIPDFQRDFIATLILDNLPKIFSILVRLGQTEYILNFLYRKEHDIRLPLSTKSLEEIATGLDYSQFVECQEEYIAPILSRGDLHIDIPPSSVLPFQKDDYINAGGLGQIFEVVLDSQHQDIVPTTGPTVSEDIHVLKKSH